MTALLAASAAAFHRMRRGVVLQIWYIIQKYWSTPNLSKRLDFFIRILRNIDHEYQFPDNISTFYCRAFQSFIPVSAIKRMYIINASWILLKDILLVPIFRSFLEQQLSELNCGANSTNFDIQSFGYRCQIVSYN